MTVPIKPCHCLGQMKDEDSYSCSWLAAVVDEAGTSFLVAQRGIGVIRTSMPSLDMQAQCPAV